MFVYFGHAIGHKVTEINDVRLFKPMVKHRKHYSFLFVNGLVRFTLFTHEPNSVVEYNLSEKENKREKENKGQT